MARSTRERAGRAATLLAGAIAIAAALPAAAPAAVRPPAVQAQKVSFDGLIESVARMGGNTYVAGKFTSEAPLTGGGLVVPLTGDGNPASKRFPQVAGAVTAAVSDGRGGWYIAGRFAGVGGRPAKNLAHIKPDGTVDANFKAQTDQQCLGVIQYDCWTSLALDGNRLYVAGVFTKVNGVARKGLAAVSASTGALVTDWAPNTQDPALNFVDPVTAITARNGVVYIGGNFKKVNGQTRKGLASLDSKGRLTSWDPTTDGMINALSISGGKLYVGGIFTKVGGANRNSLASFPLGNPVPTNWTPSVYGTVLDLAVAANGTAVVVGEFRFAGGRARSSIAAFGPNGRLTSFDPDIRQTAISSVAISGSTVFVVGQFDEAGGLPRNWAASFDLADGSVNQWNPQIQLPNSGWGAVVVRTGPGSAYVGGAFTGAGKPLGRIPYLARLKSDGSLDTSWSPTPDDEVRRVVAIPGRIFVNGAFGMIGGRASPGLAAISPSSSLQLWNGVAASNSSINASATLAESGPWIFGSFTKAGTNAADAAYISLAPNLWDGALYQGSGYSAPDGEVRKAVANADGSKVYLLGSFKKLGSASRVGLGALDRNLKVTDWNPTSNWVAGDTYYDFAIDGDNLFVAGSFGHLNSSTQRNLQKLDANSGATQPWSIPSMPVLYQVEVVGELLLAAGGFQSIGGQPHVNLVAIDQQSGGVLPANIDLGANTVSWNGDGALQSTAGDGERAVLGGYFSSIGPYSAGNFAVIK